MTAIARVAELRIGAHCPVGLADGVSLTVDGVLAERCVGAARGRVE